VSVEDSIFKLSLDTEERVSRRYMSERIQISNLYAFALYSNSKWIQEAIEIAPFLLLRHKERTRGEANARNGKSK
jgi:hypothetical protein